jgi:uncharacterized protein YndB with AHSA1/START domain
VTVRRQRRLAAAPEEIWRVVADPWRLPAWWPGVSRVEDATAEAWTTVMTSAKGRAVRADFTRVEADEPRRLVWRQELAETPFERLLAESATEVALEPDDGGTRVRIGLVQSPRGWARFAPIQLRVAARRQLEGALDGLGELFAPTETRG